MKTFAFTRARRHIAIVLTAVMCAANINVAIVSGSEPDTGYPAGTGEGLAEPLILIDGAEIGSGAEIPVGAELTAKYEFTFTPDLFSMCQV